MTDEQKEVLARAIAAARESTQRLQSPMPHTIARKRRLEKRRK